jgi:antitoxin VapB
MALSIKNPETERLARELARVTGESLTEAVTEALRDRLVRTTGRRDPQAVLEAVREIQAHFKRLPVLEEGTDDELIGYDEYGLPT